jgi:hypothetical protein
MEEGGGGVRRQTVRLEGTDKAIIQRSAPPPASHEWDAGAGPPPLFSTLFVHTGAEGESYGPLHPVSIDASLAGREQRSNARLHMCVPVIVAHVERYKHQIPTCTLHQGGCH